MDEWRGINQNPQSAPLSWCIPVVAFLDAGVPRGGNRTVSAGPQAPNWVKFWRSRSMIGGSLTGSNVWPVIIS